LPTRYGRGAVGSLFIVSISLRVVSLLHLVSSARVSGPSLESRGSHCSGDFSTPPWPPSHASSLSRPHSPSSSRMVATPGPELQWMPMGGYQRGRMPTGGAHAWPTVTIPRQQPPHVLINVTVRVVDTATPYLAALLRFCPSPALPSHISNMHVRPASFLLVS
jgi:hypothetical protein